MKRALLIAGGTVGGLGAVLAITPPQLTSSGSINIAGGSAIGSTGTSSSASASSTSTKAVATASATKTAKPVATKKATPAASATATETKSATPTAAATTAVATPAAKSGTFTGPAVFVNYGTVQVKITVQNGKIVDAVAVQAPSGRNDRYTNMAVPILKQQTLAAQSANIKGASGASYTSYGWFKSLQGALADAGL
ncbi:hypothetical protein MCEMRE191_01352 [Candidatus Nanopelagicaceae bacterium]